MEEEKESGEFLYSGVMRPFPVTVIYEGQKHYNIPAANQRNGSKMGEKEGGVKCVCLCVWDKQVRKMGTADGGKNKNREENASIK